MILRLLKLPLLQFFIILLAIGCQSSTVAAQTQSDRFWLAARYDRDRILVYFDAVHFADTFPKDAKEIPCPMTIGLFCPVELPASYIQHFQKEPNAEKFGLEDKYDLIINGVDIATVTLTTLVGFKSDEGVGNNSFIGALATLEKDKQDWMYFAKNYLVVRRHQEAATGSARPKIRTVYARLAEIRPVRFDIQTELVDLLTERMKTMATAPERQQAESIAPFFAVQEFCLPNGDVRYYARAGWSSGKGPTTRLIYALAAWVDPLPKPHILAVESNSGFDFLPDLVNVTDLGGGKMVIIVSQHGDDSGEMTLLEYSDGMDLGHMRVLQSVGAGQ